MALLARFDERSLRTAVQHAVPSPGGAPLPSDRVCGRCKANQAEAVVRGEDACKQCAVSYVSKRARGALTAPPLLGHSVAVALSGGACSSMLLDQAQGIMHCGRRRRWWSAAVAVHVEHGAPLSALLARPQQGVDGRLEEGEERRAATRLEAAAALTRSVLTTALRSGLVSVVVPVECGVPGAPLGVVVVLPPGVTPPAGGSRGRSDPLVRTYVHSEADVAGAVDAAMVQLASLRACAAFAPHAARFHTLLSSRGLSVDARQGVLDSFIQRLCVEVASSASIPHVLFGACVDRLAEHVMCAAACGAGDTVPCDVAPVDRRWMGGTQGGRVACVVRADGGLEAAPPLPTVWYAAEQQDGPAGAASPPWLQAQPSAGGALLHRPFLELERNEIRLYASYRGLAVTELPTFVSAHGVKGSAAAVNASVLSGLHAAFPSTLHNVVKTARKLALPWEESGALCVSPPRLRLCTLCHGLSDGEGGGEGEGEGGSTVHDSASWCKRCSRLGEAWADACRGGDSVESAS